LISARVKGTSDYGCHEILAAAEFDEMVERLSQFERSAIDPGTWIAPMKNGTPYLANRPECAIDLRRSIFSPPDLAGTHETA
jgi:hypothetical protein